MESMKAKPSWCLEKLDQEKAVAGNKEAACSQFSASGAAQGRLVPREVQDGNLSPLQGLIQVLGK